MIEKIVYKSLRNKYALIFAAGMATATVGKKVFESEAVQDAAMKGMAVVMTAKKGAEDAVQGMVDNAEEVVINANSKVRKEIYVSDDEE